MLTIRRAGERGHTRLAWLDSRHSFSFGEYLDRAHMGFGPIRVINDDRVAGGGGFPSHGHADMEIISYVIEGALEHKDSLGNGSQIRVGDVQRMTAGTGIRHSEFNASATAPVHFLQIWIVPERRGIAPGYEQRHFAADEKRGRFRLIASRDGREGSVTIHRDAGLSATLIGPGERATRALAPQRAAWLQVARGAVRANGVDLAAGDGAALAAGSALELTGIEDAEALLLDVPATDL